MGNAISADASGYLSNYYNPAGLAKASKRKLELVGLDVEGTVSPESLGRALSAESLGIYRLNPKMQENPGKYTYFNFSSVPAISGRGWGVSLLANYRYAAESDGTNLDIDSVVDFGPSVGVATNLFSNAIKIGIAGKALLRSQLKGNFAHADIATEEATASRGTEGIAAGADMGILLTMPYRWIPTFGVVWKDLLNTRFISASHFFNSRAQGLPEAIPQTVNAAFSIHPVLGKRFKGTFAFEVKHLERNDIPFRKKVHFGIQLEDEKSLYVWFGLNQFYPTAGLALRLPGGNLEVGYFGQEIGEGDELRMDPRFAFRYTIGF